MLLKELGQLADAASLYQRALAILERNVEPDHPNLLACRANYQRLLEKVRAQRQADKSDPNRLVPDFA